MPKQTTVSKSELAAELQLTRARISQLVNSGLPVQSDGRLDRKAALEWLVSTRSSRGWSGRGKQDLAEVAARLLVETRGKGTHGADAAAGADDKRSLEFDRGCRWLAQSFCRSVRLNWPQFMSEIPLDGIPSDEQVATRAALCALMLHLTESWLEDFIDLKTLPKIDWTGFGSDAGEVEKATSELIAGWERAESSE